MSDLPREIMEEARRIARLFGSISRDDIMEIAKALLSRDQRAVEIVNGEAMAYAGLREGVILERAAGLITAYDDAPQGEG